MAATVAVSGWLAAAAIAAAWRILLARRMELVARACHELRGPLTAARLAAQFAGRGIGGPAAARGPLEAIDLELGRARLALDDLAAAQRGGRAADRACTFDVGVLLVDVAEAWRAFAVDHGVRLRVDQPSGRVLVHGDRTRLAQACGNLLANAIEHGGGGAAALEGREPTFVGEGGEVVLRARAGTHTARIEVLDDGPGLPASVTELVRRPRAGRGARGRGLAIAADVAARHRGRLAAAPSERGARLVLELPTAEPAKPSPGGSGSVGRTRPGARSSGDAKPSPGGSGSVGGTRPGARSSGPAGGLGSVGSRRSRKVADLPEHVR